MKWCEVGVAAATARKYRACDLLASSIRGPPDTAGAKQSIHLHRQSCTTMFDVSLRPWKDSLFKPIASAVPLSVTPGSITLFAFLCGCCCCASAAHRNCSLSLVFWVLNRSLDCLDGAVARERKQQSDLGGFLDLLYDFIIYSAIPMACAWMDPSPSTWFAVAFLESTFHINNFVLFYASAIQEKAKVQGDEGTIDGLTSVAMKPALVEGFESAVFFTAMLAWPQHTLRLAVGMAISVTYGILERVLWLSKVL